MRHRSMFNPMKHLLQAILQAIKEPRALFTNVIFCVAVLCVGLGTGLVNGFTDASARARPNDARVQLGSTVIAEIPVTALPQEAQTVLQQIRNGGPFAYAKDGVIFGNYEKILPPQKRGYYHEYTVATPRIKGRGARRLITGGVPASTDEIYYTDDHYQSFRKLKK